MWLCVCTFSSLEATCFHFISHIFLPLLLLLFSLLWWCSCFFFLFVSLSCDHLHLAHRHRLTGCTLTSLFTRQLKSVTQIYSVKRKLRFFEYIFHLRWITFFPSSPGSYCLPSSVCLVKPFTGLSLLLHSQPFYWFRVSNCLSLSFSYACSFPMKM